VGNDKTMGIAFQLPESICSPRRNMALVACALAALSAGTAACSSGPTQNTLATKQSVKSQQHELTLRASVAASSQTSNGYAVTAATVTVPESRTGSVTTAGVAYLSVAPQVGSKPGDAVGYVKVKEGTHHGVVIPIHDKLTTGTYFLLLGTGQHPTDTIVNPLAETKVVVTVP
jgi:hypothetical protein